MKKFKTPELIDFVSEIVIPFYQIKRANPLNFDSNRRENDAEHSWSLALVALTLAPHIDPKLDVGKISRYAIIHDLVEIYAGDTSNFADDKYKASKQDRENKALEKLEKYLGSEHWIIESIKEYESQETDESRFVKSVDKLLPLIFDIIDKGNFYRREKMTLERWKRLMQNHREKASAHADVFKYYDEIWNTLVSNPRFFHPNK